MSRAKTALLVQTDNYREVLELRPCDAVPSLIEIRVASWWRDAKNPERPQVRFQAFVAPEALVSLNNAVEAVLARSGGRHEQGRG